MADEPTTFEEFWPYYVSQHMNPTCRVLHFVGTTLAFGCLIAAAAVGEPLLLAAAPVVGYGMAWIGHFGFEKNRPASWYSLKHFVWSFMGDMRLWWFTLTGRMAGVVRSIS